MNKKEFGGLLKSRREELGITQKELGELVGEEALYVYSIESGRYELNSGKFFKWAKALRVDPRKFYDMAGAEFPLEKPPERYIALPFDFPAEDQHQVELFVKFLQFTRMMEYKGDQPDWETFIKEVRESGTKEVAS